MSTINPYLNFAGNTEEAFNFYKSIFGGDFLMLQRYSDVQGADQMPPGVKDKIMHVSLRIGDNILMASDACEELGYSVTQGNNFYVCLNPDSKEEADRIFNALAEGGKVEMPIQDMFWGAYWGSVKDKFGIQWMVNYDKRSLN
jgi:PhnB protein